MWLQRRATVNDQPLWPHFRFGELHLVLNTSLFDLVWVDAPRHIKCTFMDTSSGTGRGDQVLLGERGIELFRNQGDLPTWFSGTAGRIEGSHIGGSPLRLLICHNLSPANFRQPTSQACCQHTSACAATKCTCCPVFAGAPEVIARYLRPRSGVSGQVRQCLIHDLNVRT